jgi:hypothetical protein
MPALARLALGTGERYYLSQFLFHLNRERIAAFSAEQRAAVRDLLIHIRDTMAQEVDAEGDIQDLETRIADLAG